MIKRMANAMFRVIDSDVHVYDPLHFCSNYMEVSCGRLYKVDEKRESLA